MTHGFDSANRYLYRFNWDWQLVKKKARAVLRTGLCCCDSFSKIRKLVLFGKQRILRGGSLPSSLPSVPYKLESLRHS